MTESGNWQYEEYLHEGSDFAPMKEEIARREKAGWSLWSTANVGEHDVLLRFRYPGAWIVRLPAVEPPTPSALTTSDDQTDQP